MNRIAILLGLALAGLMVAGPASAGCPFNSVCVTIPINSTAEDIANLVEANWNAGDFDCNAVPTSTGTIRITAETGQRVIAWEVPAGSTLASHTYDLRFALPTNIPELPVNPFDMFVNFDESGEIPIPDGVTTLGEILMVVETRTGPVGGQPTILPALDRTHAALAILGFLVAGVAYILVRRT